MAWVPFFWAYVSISPRDSCPLLPSSKNTFSGPVRFNLTPRFMTVVTAFLNATRHQQIIVSISLRDSWPLLHRFDSSWLTTWLFQSHPEIHGRCYLLLPRLFKFFNLGFNLPPRFMAVVTRSDMTKAVILIGSIYHFAWLPDYTILSILPKTTVSQASVSKETWWHYRWYDALITTLGDERWWNSPKLFNPHGKPLHGELF